MKKSTLITFLLFMGIRGNPQNLPKVVSGTVRRIENFRSKYVDASNVGIWLPDGYIESKNYSVYRDWQYTFIA